MTPTSGYEYGTATDIPKPKSLEHTLSSKEESPPGGSHGLDTTNFPRTFSTNSNVSNSDPRPSPAPPTSSLSKSRSPLVLRSQSHERLSVSSRDASPSIALSDSNQEYRQIIVRSFAPRVAVYASADTEEFVKQKGFDGLYRLLRPYGERLTGRVIIRDSVGGSKGWDDFGVRFIDAKELQCSSIRHEPRRTPDLGIQSLSNSSQYVLEHRSHPRSDQDGATIEQLLNRRLQIEDTAADAHHRDYCDCHGRAAQIGSSASTLYTTYLRKLLANAAILPHETFSHPVACMIAVSSHHPAPIEALRQLYAGTGHGSNKTPTWVGTDYLRYYVLIHDEENDDITKSTALFDLMKRHFGLHCHLLRLRSSQCVQTDDDSSKVPSCEWLSAEEELDEIRTRDYADDVENTEKYVLDSDATAVRALLREMVVQSIVPFMESRVMTWNDQVASRRRGISGRFMSLSKRWTNFGSNKGATSGSGGSSNASGSNYDHQRGFYPPETPEATMRQLGDYAFMLRDWKLAHSTYESLRSDFNHDKAWNYHAAANEMVAITSLLMTQTYNSSYKLEVIDQMLDTAAYSYLTRCSMRFSVVRCFTLAIELLKDRGTVAADGAARWGGKLLELGVLDPIAQALISERIAECYMLRTSLTVPNAITRKRQAALWNTLSADSWASLNKPIQARFRLKNASALYGPKYQQPPGPPFPSMQTFWQKLERSLWDTAYPQWMVEAGLGGAHLEFSTMETEHLSALNCPIDSEVFNTEGFTTQDAGRSNLNPGDGMGLQSDDYE